MLANEIDTTASKIAPESQATVGNTRCFICRRLRVLPFRRCRNCVLAGANQCPTVKAGGVLIALAAAFAAVAYVIGGPAGQTLFVMTGLITAVLLLLINAHSNEQARGRVLLAQLRRELAQQHDFLKDLSPLDSLRDCMNHIVTGAAERLGCRRVSVMLVDDDRRYLRVAAACGLDAEVASRTRILIGQQVSGQVFQADAPIHVHDAKAERGDDMLPIDSLAFMSGPLLLSGIRWGKTRLGVLSVTEPIGRTDFSIDDEFVFSNICEASAVAIHNHKALEKVKQANVEFLETLVNAIEARDKYTRGHSERVGRYAIAVGRRLAMNDEELADLQMAGRLHDIGKIGMPDAILDKPAAPTPQEWQTIYQHTDVATKMLARASLVSAAIDAIRCHHERLDGSGYPHGLRGEQIPLAARIVCVADAFDAMTTARAYHDPLPVDEALAELEAQPQKLDLRCVQALAQALRCGELDEVLPAPAGV